ncbi:MAG: amidohydrolase family protein, partial [Gammaproteobacteria bacterium]
NGDAAIDLLIEAHRRVGATPSADRRNVVIHSQFVRQDQLEAYARLGIAASFFSNHTFFWGEVHRRNLGEERAGFLSPLAAATALGLHFSNHSDYGVTPLDPLFMVWTATTRQTRSARVLGPDQRIDTLTALRALGSGPAWIYREENEKGSIEAGKRADFVLLDRDPLAVEPAELRSLRILATVKDDRLVHGAF